MKAVDEPGRVVDSPERQSSEDEPSRPPLGSVAQREQRLSIQRGGREQVSRLVGLEPEIGRADLGELPSDAQSAESERRVGSRCDHDLDVSRAEVDESFDAVVDHRVVDDVIVVDHDHQPVRTICQRIDQRRDDRVGRPSGRDDGRLDDVPHARSSTIDRPDEIRPEPDGISIACFHLDPDEVIVATGQCSCEERRLARTGRGTDEHEPVTFVDRSVEQCVQAGAPNQTDRHRRHLQFRGDQLARTLPDHRRRI